MSQANLTSEDRSELELMLTASPSLRIAHELKEELIAVYNSDITASGGMRQMKKWLISARVMFGSAADTLKSHLEEICNYFTNRTTSGVTEGINTRIKLIIRQSYGFKNFDLMKEKLLACLSPHRRESHRHNLSDENYQKVYFLERLSPIPSTRTASFIDDYNFIFCQLSADAIACRKIFILSSYLTLG